MIKTVDQHTILLRTQERSGTGLLLFKRPVVYMWVGKVEFHVTAGTSHCARCTVLYGMLEEMGCAGAGLCCATSIIV